MASCPCRDSLSPPVKVDSANRSRVERKSGGFALPPLGGRRSALRAGSCLRKSHRLVITLITFGEVLRGSRMQFPPLLVAPFKFLGRMQGFRVLILDAHRPADFIDNILIRCRGRPADGLLPH